MKRIGTINKTKEIIHANSFMMKKNYGQNFLIDQNILEGICDKAEITKDINVIEIGPGIGSLTEHLLERANKVISYEIDNKLIPILTDLMSDYDNFTLINKDVLKADIKADIKKYFNDDKPIYLVANLPYYITTPIIMEMLENHPEIKRYAVMMQVELADRICATKGGKDYNSLSVAIQYRANVYKGLNVSRNVFMPKPNVDSAVLVFDILDKPLYEPKDEKVFFRTVRASFANRRKTLTNNMNAGFGISKDECAKILESLGINPQARSEELGLKEFVLLSDKISEII